MTNYKRGDVVLALFPNSNLQTAKRRPALIVQADNQETGLPQVIVAMITSNMERADHRSRVSIMLNSSENKESGLQTDSVIVTDNLVTVQEKFVNRVLGKMPTMANVQRALAHTFGLNLAE